MQIKRIMIGLQPDILKLLDDQAKAENRSRSNYIKTLILEKNLRSIK